MRASKLNRERLKITVRGAVQGVGFRPFVYRLAAELKLKGWVSNSTQGVHLEAEGNHDSLRELLLRLEKERPPRAVLQSLESSFLDAVGYQNFEIRQSAEDSDKRALILPDIAPCADCLREIFDANDRRFHYPFTNCTNCGPRFSIIEALPYDRPNTSMRLFALCPDCKREYRDPLNRRFHAQPTACPRCGPHLELWDSLGATISQADLSLRQAAEQIAAGKIIALKGIGGFQLLVDAGDAEAVLRLRERKHREAKPFAVMFPSLESMSEYCEISELEERLLTSPEAPIVILKQWAMGNWQLAIAPGNPNLGAMLPSSPLHHLLMRELNFPIVATSGNLSDEPICIDEWEALERLRGIADFFLVHNRPIVRHVDDSVVRVMCSRELVLRRARGYAPLPLSLKSEIRRSAACAAGEAGPSNPKSEIILAVGAHLKNAVALSVGSDVFISQHIGDLETSQAWSAFRKTAADLPRLYDASPAIIACDLHPEYLSTKYAHEISSDHGAAAGKPPLLQVQHHWAHISSCMAENELAPPVLGVSWDGTGYGTDGTIWGGEFLLAGIDSFERVAHLRTFRLPGDDAAIREPRRVALALLFEIYGPDAFRKNDLAPVKDFTASEIALLQQMLVKQVHSPITSSAGRLFDAIASLIGLRQRVSFEGQAAMELEFVRQTGVQEIYPFKISDGLPATIDWRPMVESIVSDLRGGQSPSLISAKFHNTLVEMIAAVATKMGEEKVVLTGGCFQNRYLTERCVERLRAAGFRPYWHQRIPPNDGGIALGQIMAVARISYANAVGPVAVETA